MVHAAPYQPTTVGGSQFVQDIRVYYGLDEDGQCHREQRGAVAQKLARRRHPRRNPWQAQTPVHGNGYHQGQASGCRPHQQQPQQAAAKRQTGDRANQRRQLEHDVEQRLTVHSFVGAEHPAESHAEVLG